MICGIMKFLNVEDRANDSSNYFSRNMGILDFHRLCGFGIRVVLSMPRVTAYV